MPSVYYAVCPGTGGTNDKKTGSPTITIASGVATLSVAQTGNIGQGFRITYDTSKVCFISKVNSATSFGVVTATGGTPSDEASSVSVDSITADYASLSAAEAGASDANHLNTSDLVTATTILNLVCYAGASADTTACTVDGYTTSADYCINIYVPSGGTQSLSNNRHAGIWDTSKYRLDPGAGYTPLTVDDNYVYLDGLQTLTSGTSNYRYGITSSGAQGFQIRNCLVRFTSTGNYCVGIVFEVGAGTGRIENCIVWGVSGGYGCIGIDTSASNYTSINVRNCTVFGCYVGYGSAYGDTTFTNCAAFNNTDDFNAPGCTISYCASDDGDGTNAVDLADSAASWDAQFKDYDATNPDVSLVGNSLLLMTGIGPDSDANVPTTDIAGNPRADTLTSIGAFNKPLTDVYYSVSMYGTGDIKTTTGTLTCGISSGTMTVSEAQTGNIGIGCAITYDTSKVVYISEYTDSTHFKVVDKYGVTPPDIAAGTTVNSIAHVFADLSTAESSAGGSSYLSNDDLVSYNCVLNLCCYYDHDDYTPDPGMARFFGWDVDSTHYIQVIAPNGGTQSRNVQRHSGVWDANKFHLIRSSTADSDYCILLNTHYCVIDGLQARLNSGTAADGSCFNSTASGLTVIDCIAVLNTTNAGYGFYFLGDTYANAVRNCVAIGIGSGTGGRGFLVAGTATIYNCTCYGANFARGIWSFTASGLTAINCVVKNTGDDWYGTFASLIYCASDDNDVSGTGNISISSTAIAYIWNDIANGDATLVGNSPLLMTGTGPGSTTGIPETDIAGNPRAGTLTSIGAFHKELTDVYYSLSPFGTDDIKTGSPTCGIASGVMTLNTAQTGNIGIGCKITYDTSKVVYISAVNSSTSFDVVDKYGVTPPDISAGTTVNSIAHNWASLSAAEAGADDSGYLNTADLTSANVRLNLCCYYDHDDYTADDGNAAISGYTTDSTRYINIFAPGGDTESIYSQRHNGVWDDHKFKIERTDGNLLTIYDSYTRISHLQAFVTASSGIRVCYYMYSTETSLGMRVFSCIARGSISGSGNGQGIYSRASAYEEQYIYNNLIYDFNGAGTDSRGISSSSSSASNVHIYNNTVINCIRGIQIGSSATSSYIKNNMVYGCTDAFYGTTTNAANNISETETFGSGSSTTSQTTAQLFTDYDNDDFSVKDTDSDLYDAGTDLSAYFTTDIAGTTRSTWDIGAFEYVASGSISGSCDESFTFVGTLTKTAVLGATALESVLLTDPTEKLATFFSTADVNATINAITSALKSINATASVQTNIGTNATSLKEVATIMETFVSLQDVLNKTATAQGTLETNVQISTSSTATAALIAAILQTLILTGVAETEATSLIVSVCDETFTLGNVSIADATKIATLITSFSASTTTQAIVELNAALQATISLASDTNYGSIVAGILEQFLSYTVNSVATGEMLSNAQDNITITTLINNISTLLTVITDNIVFSDAANWVGIITAILSEYIDITTATEVARLITSIGTQNITVNTETNTNVTFNIALADNIAISDAMLIVKTVASVCADMFNIDNVSFWMEATGKVTISFTLAKSNITFNLI